MSKKSIANFLPKTGALIHYGINMDAHIKEAATHGCPCRPIGVPEERKHCPCHQAISELKQQGYCLCRVFVTTKYFQGVFYNRNPQYLLQSIQKTRRFLDEARSKG